MSRTDLDYSVPRRDVPAWLISCGMHLAILFLLWLVLRPVFRGAPAEGERETGIVLVSADPQAQYLTEGSLDSASPSENDQAAAESPFPKNDAVNVDLPGLPSGDQVERIGESVGDGLPSADGLLNGTQANKNIGGKVKTEIFGVQGEGTRFIYVFDRSDSMEGFGGRPMAAAKSQLIASLRSLGPTQQFQIIFYNEAPMIFNPNPNFPPQMLFANDDNKRLAEAFIRGMQGSGGTRHLPALELALGLAPDVIFFLTDAQEPRLSDDELNHIDKMNRSTASINCIEFGSKDEYDRNNFLVRIATASGGKHAYKNVLKLTGD